MSLDLVTPYFEDKLVELGWTLWDEPFAFDNIPSDILDHGFQIETGDLTGEGITQTVLETRMDVTVRLFRKGYKTPKTIKEELLTEVQHVLCLCLTASNRLTAGIKNIEFLSMVPTPLNLENDNAIVATCIFRCRVILNIGI